MDNHQGDLGQRGKRDARLRAAIQRHRTRRLQRSELTTVEERRAAWTKWVAAVSECQEQGEYDLDILETYFQDCAFDDYLNDLQDIANARDTV